MSRSYTGSEIHRYDSLDGIRPESPNRNNKRTGIAFHKGGSWVAIGCLTFNTFWKKKSGNTRNQNKKLNNYNDFNKILYPGSDEEGNEEEKNKKKLNFLCIDERHAVNSTTHRLYHDLIDSNGVVES